MKIIIVGAGTAGELLIKTLAEDGHDVVLIEKSPDVIKEMTDEYNVTGVSGSGASLATLEKAGAATADMLLALTAIDEVNLLCCLQAKNLGTKKTVARLLLQDLSLEKARLMEQYAIDHIVCPKSDLAKLVAQNAGLPGSVKLEGFFEDEIIIMSVYIDCCSPLVGKMLKEIKRDVDSNLLVAAIARKDKIFIPAGDFMVDEGDNLYLVADKNSQENALKEVGVSRNNGRKVLIVGGGIDCEYLVDLLHKEKRSISILESDKNNCRRLMEKYPEVNVSYGDGESIDVLEEEQVEKKDVVISLTGKDETNLVVSLFAWAKGVSSIITRVDSPNHAKLLHKVNMDITVSTAEATINNIMRFIKNYEMGDAKNEIRRFYSICDGRAEIMEFCVTDSCKNLGKEFKEPSFKLKKDVLVASIIRDSNVIIPNGSSKLLAGDKVIIVSIKKNRLLSLNDIFD